MEDPAAVEGADSEKERAFVTAFEQLKSRISAFVSIPVEEIDSPTLVARLKAIGQMEGATSGYEAAK